MKKSVRVRVRGNARPGSECCVVEGDDRREAYTTIVWGVGLSEMAISQGLRRSMCRRQRVRRRHASTVALPGSEATSRTKGSRWNLGDLVWPAVAVAIPSRGRKARSRSCHGTGEEWDEPRSTGEALQQGRDERRRRAWREGGSVGEMVEGNTYRHDKARKALDQNCQRSLVVIDPRRANRLGNC
jgi:hypothetical protein